MAIPGQALERTAGRARTRLAALGVLGLAHGTVDLYGAFLTPIVALVLAPRFGLGEADAARLLALHVAVVSLGQPLFAYLSDRLGGRWLVALAPGLCGLCAGAFLHAPTLPLLLLLIVGCAAGVAAFHPEGAARAGGLDGPRSAAATGLFMAAGSVGMTIGPLLVTWAARQPQPPLWLPALGLAVALLLAAALPPAAGRRPRLRAGTRLKVALAGRARGLALLVLLSASRYFVATAMSFGLPLLLLERLTRERAVAASGLWLSLFLAASALGGVLGSSLARPSARAHVLSYALAAPALALLPRLDGAPALGVLIVAGLAVGWTTPLLLALGQRALPEAAASASALMLGVSWALGGPIAPIAFQWLRQATSTAWAMAALGGTCLGMALLFLLLPARLAGEA